MWPAAPVHHRGSCCFPSRFCIRSSSSNSRLIVPLLRQRGCVVYAKKGFAKKAADAAQKASGGKGSKQKTRKAAPSNILAPAQPSPNSREELFMQQQERDRTGVTADNLEFEQRLEKLRKQGELVQQRRPKPAASADLLAAGPLASPLKPPQARRPAEKEEGGSTFGVPQIAVGVISLALAITLVVTSVGGGGGPVASPEELGLSAEQREQLEKRAKELEAAVKASPEDTKALRELSDLSAALGQFKRSGELAEAAAKASPEDAQAWLALADARLRLSDFRGAATAYEKSLAASAAPSLPQLQGLAGTLVADKRPGEAIQQLQGYEAAVASSSSSEGLGPVELQLLIGKVYSQWERHFASALAVYDGIIDKYPDDFRGYLAKGALLKENGRKGDAQRMFIQARFLAPPEARAVVDAVSTR